MGERKGQNKYYPPDFDYKVHKSLAGYHGQHPLRERARKLDRGILIIRFEMPYNIWCDGCNNHIGMGVRYNAEKSKDGMYYSTPIYKFRMKCHLCDNHFEIKTDPANHDYVIISGARRKEQRWDPHENEQIVPEDRATQKQLALNAMYKLEHGEEDRTKGKSKQSTISQILEHKEREKDDFSLNQLARKQFRDAKKSLKREQMKDEAITKKYGLDIKLLKEHPDDERIAKLLKFSTSRESNPETDQGLLFGQRQNTPLSSPSTSSNSALTKRDISVNRLRHIASSEMRKKRSEAFLSFPATDHCFSATETDISSRVTLHRKQKPVDEDSFELHLNDNEQSKNKIQEKSELNVSEREAVELIPVTANISSNSALTALSNDYTSCTDDDNDSDNNSVYC